MFPTTSTATFIVEVINPHSPQTFLGWFLIKEFVDSKRCLLFWLDQLIIQCRPFQIIMSPSYISEPSLSAVPIHCIHIRSSHLCRPVSAIDAKVWLTSMTCLPASQARNSFGIVNIIFQLSHLFSAYSGRCTLLPVHLHLR